MRTITAIILFVATTSVSVSFAQSPAKVMERPARQSAAIFDHVIFPSSIIAAAKAADMDFQGTVGLTEKVIKAMAEVETAMTKEMRATEFGLVLSRLTLADSTAALANSKLRSSDSKVTLTISEWLRHQTPESMLRGMSLYDKWYAGASANYYVLPKGLDELEQRAQQHFLDLLANEAREKRRKSLEEFEKGVPNVRNPF